MAIIKCSSVHSTPMACLKYILNPKNGDCIYSKKCTNEIAEFNNSIIYFLRYNFYYSDVEGDILNRRLYTISEAAAMIDGLSEYRVRQMCRSGELHCFKAGRKYLISEDALMRAVFGDNSCEKDKNVS